MGATLRALRALVLLSGFYLISLVLLAALAGADVALFHWGLRGIGAVKIGIVTVLLAVPVVRGLFMLRIPAAEDPAAVEVGEADEPRLWALVREVAEASGTHAPARILLTPDVNASVREDAKLLGLRPGPRTLTLGVPLLTGLSEAQLRAVLGHEYGHFTAGDTRLSAIVVRGRTQIGRVVEQFHATADGKVADERERQERTAAKRMAKGKKAREVDTGTPARCTGGWPGSTPGTPSSICAPRWAPRAASNSTRTPPREEVARAAALNPDDPTPYVAEIWLTLGLGYPNARMDDLWTEITARAPHHYEAHFSALQYWCAKWRGSERLATEFAERAAAAAPAGSLLTALPLIAHFEHDDSDDTAADNTPEMVARVEAALRDAAVADPAHPRLPEVRHLLAYYLHLQGRDAAAVEHFRLFDGHVDALPWRYRNNKAEYFCQVRDIGVREAGAAARTGMSGAGAAL